MIIDGQRPSGKIKGDAVTSGSYLVEYSVLDEATKAYFK